MGRHVPTPFSAALPQAARATAPNNPSRQIRGAITRGETANSVGNSYTRNRTSPGDLLSGGTPVNDQLSASDKGRFV